MDNTVIKWVRSAPSRVCIIQIFCREGGAILRWFTAKPSAIIVLPLAYGPIIIKPLGRRPCGRVTGVKSEAKKFLDSRESNRRDVRELAMRFAISKPKKLCKHFREALAAFPKDLPYGFAKQRSNAAVTTELAEKAKRWPHLATSRTTAITGRTRGRVHRLGYAISRDVLTRRRDAENHSSQTVLSAVAVVGIRFAQSESLHHTWAWNVMDRVAKMAEPANIFGGECIPWHPA